MKVFSHFFSIIIIASISAPAQAIDLSGYYENTLMPEYSDRAEDHLLDASKLRLDFSTGGGDDNLEFRGNVNFIAYHSDIILDVTPYLPESIADSLHEREIPAEIRLDRSRIFLDNAYLTWRIGQLRLRAGRQQLSWGPAYSFNPTDLFHKKDLFDPTYEKEGVTALRLDYRWGIGGQVALVTVPGVKLDQAGYALRIATHVSAIGYDAALTLHQIEDSTSLDPDSLRSLHQRRRAVGLDFSGGLLGLGVWLEGNYNLMETGDDFTRIAAGFDYTLENGLYMMFEGLYNGRAEDKTPYPVTDWLESIYFGEPVARYRFLAGIRKDLSDLVEGSVYWFGGADGSMVLNPRLDASIAQNADLTLFGAATFGKKDGQFPPGNYAVTARVTVYF